jgi:hypothetical protein
MVNTADIILSIHNLVLQICCTLCCTLLHYTVLFSTHATCQYMHCTVLYPRYLPVHASHVTPRSVHATLRANPTKVLHLYFVPHCLVNLRHPEQLSPVQLSCWQLSFDRLPRGGGRGEMVMHGDLLEHLILPVWMVVAAVPTQCMSMVYECSLDGGCGYAYTVTDL